MMCDARGGALCKRSALGLDRKGMLTAADAAAVLLGSLGLEVAGDCPFGLDNVRLKLAGSRSVPSLPLPYLRAPVTTHLSRSSFMDVAT